MDTATDAIGRFENWQPSRHTEQARIAMADVRHDPDCELCEAARISPWFHEDDVCWVAECEACAVPMVVWRPHGIDPTETDHDHMIERLHEVAAAQLGEHWLDPDRRSIPGHWHVHARPKGRFNGWT